MDKIEMADSQSWLDFLFSTVRFDAVSVIDLTMDRISIKFGQTQKHNTPLERANQD